MERKSAHRNEHRLSVHEYLLEVFMSKRSRIALMFAVLFLFTPVLAQGPLVAQNQNEDGASEEKVRQLYRKAKQQLEKEEEESVKKAYSTFQKAIETANKLDADVRGELLRWLWHSTTKHVFNRMLRDPQLKHAAERIMELAKGAYWTWRMDQERVQKLVQDLTGDDYKKQMESQRKLISTGQYGAPLLIDELKADSSRRRAMAIITLAEMGNTVVLPLIETLESNDEIQRQNAAVVLGRIGDPRAAPALKATLENDKNEQVRKEAREALKKILRGRRDYRPARKEQQSRMERMKRARKEQEKMEKDNKNQEGSEKSQDQEQDENGNQDEEENADNNNGNKGAEENNGNGENKKQSEPERGPLVDRWLRMKDTPSPEGSVQYARTVDGLNSAVELYYDLAEKYFLSKPSVMERLYGDSLVWRWNEETQRVNAREVPDFMLNEELAAQACFDLLDLDHKYNPVWPLLVNIYFNIYNESDIVLTDSKKMVQGTKDNYKLITEKAFKKLQEDLKEREQTFIPGQLVGVHVLYAALDRALRDNMPLVAISSMKVIKTLADPRHLPGPGPRHRNRKGPIGSPLISALMHNDRRVRAHAASLLVDMDPQEKFLGWERVVPALRDSVRLTGLRFVLLAEPNQKKLNQLKNVLKDPNLHSVLNVARNAEETITLAKQDPKDDLLMIDGGILGNVMYSFEVPGREESHQQRVIDAIKRDLRTRTTPIIALADDDQELESLRETYKERVDAYLKTPVKRTDLESAFEEIKKKSFDLKARERAEKIALMAAKALGNINPDGTIFTNYSEAVPALAATLADRPDDLRIQASRVLGQFADQRAVPELAKALDKSKNENDVRAAAGRGLAKIFEKTGMTPNQDILDTIARNVVEGPIPVQMAAAEAFGASNISREKRKKLLEEKQPSQLGRDRDDLNEKPK